MNYTAELQARLFTCLHQGTSMQAMPCMLETLGDALMCTLETHPCPAALVENRRKVVADVLRRYLAPPAKP
jgi:hypothetical protein